MAKGRRYTLYLTPYQEQALSALQRADLPHGAAPRSKNRVVVEAILRAYDASRPAANDERDVAGRGRRGA